MDHKSWGGELAAERFRLFKNYGKDSQELRRRRTDLTVVLRKTHKDEQLTKRRNIDDLSASAAAAGDPGIGLAAGTATIMEADSPPDAGADAKSMEDDDDEKPQTVSYRLCAGNFIQLNLISEISFLAFSEITVNIFSGEEAKELIGCQKAHDILNLPRSTRTADSLIKCGIVPKFIELLASPNVDIQFEAACIVVSILAGVGKQTQYIVDQGGVGPLIHLLSSQTDQVAEQAVLGLGNIAGDSFRLRDMLISKGVIPSLVGLLRQLRNATFLCNIAWSLSNLCRSYQGVYPFPVEATQQILPGLAQLIMMGDTEVIAHTCRALSELTNYGQNENIELVARAGGGGILLRVVQLLYHQSNKHSIVGPCLDIIGNVIGAGNELQTSRLLECGPVLPLLGKLLQDPSAIIARNAAWAISKLTAAGAAVELINQVIAHKLIPILLYVVHHGTFPPKHHVLCCILNILSTGSMDHLLYLCQVDVISALCGMLSCKDSSCLIIALECLERILKGLKAAPLALVGGELQRIKIDIEESRGLQLLESLQYHENIDVHKGATRLVEKYFNEEEDRVRAVEFDAMLLDRGATTNHRQDDEPPEQSFQMSTLHELSEDDFLNNFDF